ncbi:DUF547 domain-containing protein [Kordiimonas lacus]|uniref:DUF547 domain-containing protein n=1 Tax=Kordiimonas lacus TaxID=637679 RepID=A0A1G7AZ52_9PROT|nr:DUF547 domain-containing protein [Kordiimonas lacus]SDE20099.1 Protein of unknown function, DUF547 [Kordiimonas lacus]
MIHMSFKSFAAAVVTVVAIAIPCSAQATDTAITAFQGDTPDSGFSVDYGDLSKILNQTVWETGHSDRANPGRVSARPGSRIVRGSRKNTRNEGNRVDFHSFLGDNYSVMVALRQDLERIPENIPLRRFSRNEQLAYWLNLYNLTVLTQIAGIFPEEQLKRHYFSDGNDKGLWDEKVLTVGGVQLSLNDIHHKILIPKYRNPLIMYGLFQGVIGGPNIRDEAYTGQRVWDQLKANAREFVNSNRGARIRDRIIRTSYFYEVNEALFPDFDRDLKAHLYKHAKPHFADRISDASSKIGTGQSNWFIADLYGGNRSIAAASVNPAALLNAFTGGGSGSEGYSGQAGDAMAWGNMAIEKNMSLTRFPIHVVESVRKVQFKNKKLREGDVQIEEYDEVPVDADTTGAGTEGDPEQ